MQHIRAPASILGTPRDRASMDHLCFSKISQLNLDLIRQVKVKNKTESEASMERGFGEQLKQQRGAKEMGSLPLLLEVWVYGCTSRAAFLHPPCPRHCLFPAQCSDPLPSQMDMHWAAHISALHWHQLIALSGTCNQPGFAFPVPFSASRVSLIL